MIWAALADAVVALHFAFILFALLGGALLVRWPRLVWLHAPALAWGTWIEVSGGICPLTILENRFRDAAGAAGYGEGFIDHYLSPIIYPEGLTHETQLIYASVLLALNAAFYLRWLSKIPQRRKRRAGNAHCSEGAELLRGREIDLEERVGRPGNAKPNKTPEEGRDADHPPHLCFANVTVNQVNYQ